MGKIPSGKNPASSSGKISREAATGKFVERANSWVSANTATPDVARAKLRELGIHDNRGKLGKDYK